MKYLLILFIAFNLAYAGKVDCTMFITMQEQQVMQELQTIYKETNAELEKVMAEYKNKIEKLKELNKELNINFELTKAELLKSSEILFLAKQFNSIKSINIDIKANNEN